MSQLSAQSIRKLCEGETPMLSPFVNEKTVVNGTSFGLSAASYDVRIGHDLRFQFGVGLRGCRAQLRDRTLREVSRVVVGMDKVGDVALIKLLPREPGGKFPFATMGDSDTVKVGDWSLALGNPFLLATDFTPTVTFGMVSGVRRYQYPERGMFEYTDCIQSDTSINPGNSGGPLFNIKGELIGINGRGSFDKRGRVNSGVGYAISINQIKNFMGHLKAGLQVDHASLGAVVASSSEEEGSRPRVLVSGLIPSDAERRGLELRGELDLAGAAPRIVGHHHTARRQHGAEQLLAHLLHNRVLEQRRRDHPWRQGTQRTPRRP